MIETIIEPVFILSKKIHLERFYRDLKNEVLVSLLDTKYVNNELIFTYIQYFECQSRHTRKDTHRILFYHNYESYLTKEILKFYQF